MLYCKIKHLIYIGGEFKDIKPGVSWGTKWGYGWFLANITLPAEIQGKQIVLKLNLGAESTVYVNGKLAGAMTSQEFQIIPCCSPSTVSCTKLSEASRNPIFL